VKFDDDTDDVVDISKMRRCELQVDDTVVPVDEIGQTKVVNVSKQNTLNVVTIETDNGQNWTVEKLRLKTSKSRHVPSLVGGRTESSERRMLFLLSRARRTPLSVRGVRC